MKSGSSLVRLIPVFIIVVGVMALAVSIPNTLLNLGDSFLSLFSVMQTFWMGVLWVMAGSLLLVWRESSAHLRRMVASLILVIGIIGVIATAALGVFNGVTTVGTFDLPTLFWLAVVYIVAGVALLLVFRSEQDVETVVETESAEWKSMMAVPKMESGVIAHRSQLPPMAKPRIEAATKPIERFVPKHPETPTAAEESARVVERQAAVPPAAPEKPEEPAKLVERQAPTKPDDLTLLEGIGPKIQDALYAAGVTTFAQLAKMTPEAIEEIVKVEGKVKMIGDAATWPRQAQYLVDGDAAGFESYIKHLVAGREPDQH
jgi:predicted flap endonuclease-1-like 5' DNA nuclease